MSRFRSFLLLQLPLLTVSGLLLTGALAQQTPPAKQAAPAASASKAAPAPATPAPPKADPNATSLLNKAIGQLDISKMGLLETKIWEQVDTVGLSFQAEGSYLSAAGPDQGRAPRIRMDLSILLGNTKSQLLIVNDGAWVWNQLKLGNDDPVITKYDLTKVQESLNAPGTMPTLADGFYRSQSFRGVAPLLQSMDKDMTFTKLENATWKKHDLYKLTAVWSADVSKRLAQPGQPWPNFVPRTCYLYLGKEKDSPPYWPYRLEWWGPSGQKGDTLLMQMEFRDPYVLPAKGELPKKYAQAFAFDPGKFKAEDITKQFLEQLKQARNMPSQTLPGGTKSP